jgi:hypothetical protein
MIALGRVNARFLRGAQGALDGGRRRFRCLVLGVVVGTISLAGAGSALAFAPLPSGAQVNDDPGAGINPAQPVSGEDPTNADVVGGALTAGKVAVPWAIFRQQEPAASDQAFVRSFAGGAWTTRGAGTVGGNSSAAPEFTGSLNFDQGQDGEAPSIDFAGAGRTVPWATWYENTTGTGFTTNNVFASRFDSTAGDPNQNKWIFAGQNRGPGGSGHVMVPSLNIHTDQDAENPSVAGGSAVDPAKPGPWVTWQETSTVAPVHPDEIFVSRPEGPGMANCDGVDPAGVAVGSDVPAIGGFCWQQTGIPRFGTPSRDPTLNVDPTRNGVEPDIAFTGANDSVPWVVWYEKDNTGTVPTNQLHSNEMVFAAKGISDGVVAHGGFQWVVVGNQLPQQVLDTSGSNHGFGGCGETADAEAACSLNANPNVDAVDPRVAAGTMNPANPTAPWVTWDENVNGVDQIFVSRLVGGPTGTFQLAGGGPISTGTGNATRPDITFSGNTPYVSWRQDVGGGDQMGFYGHFVNAANPTFVLDESDVPLVPSTSADVREPISSGCTANPFNADGAACQGGAVGTPFFLFTAPGASALSLFADAYQPEAPATAPPSNVTTAGGTLNGTVNPAGAAVKVSFDFGPDTNYGQNISAGTVGVSNAATVFSANLTGQAPGSTVHYRAVATSDFGTLVGGDQTMTVAAPPSAPPPPLPPPPPPAGTIGKASVSKAKVSGLHVSLLAKCTGTAGEKCKLSFKLTIREKFRGRKLVAISTRKLKITRKTVGLGTTNVTLNAGESRTVKVFLNRKGKALLTKHRTLRVRLQGTQSLANKKGRTVVNRVFTFKAPKKKHRHK